MSEEHISPQIAGFQNFVEQVTSLPPPKRYITTHDEKSGKSVIHSSPALKFRGKEGVGGVARSYTSPGLPSQISSQTDINAYLSPDGPTSHTGIPIVNPGGTNLTVADIAPGQCSQFHRTLSLDYVICVAGRIVLELDSGDKAELNVGDHVVQRGTMHKWWNPSDKEPCRLIAVVVPAEKCEIMGSDGKTKELREEHVEGSEKADFDASKL